MDRSRTTVLVLLVLAVSGTAARADALRYRVDSSFFSAVAPALAADGVTPIVDFRPVREGDLPDLNSATAQAISLGSLVITPPAPGQTRTFSDQAFHLELRIPSLDRMTGPDSTGWWQSDRYGFMLDGTINGQVIGGGTSSLLMKVDRLQLGSIGPHIPEDRRTFHFPIDLDRLGVDPLAISLAPTSSSGTYSLLVNVKPVPEPVALVPISLLALWLLRTRKLMAARDLKG